MEASIPGTLARAQGISGESLQALHPQKLPGLRLRRQASRLDPLLHATGPPPLPLCAFGASAGHPQGAPERSTAGRVALSRRTSISQRIPSKSQKTALKTRGDKAGKVSGIGFGNPRHSRLRGLRYDVAQVSKPAVSPIS